MVNHAILGDSMSLSNPTHMLRFATCQRITDIMKLFHPFFIFRSGLRWRRRGEHHDLSRHRRVPRNEAAAAAAAGAVASEVRPCGGCGSGRLAELRVAPVRRHRHGADRCHGTRLLPRNFPSVGQCAFPVQAEEVSPLLYLLISILCPKLWLLSTPFSCTS